MASDIGWTALQWPGIEHVIVSEDAAGLRATGRLVLAEDRLISVTYEMTCDASWRFRTLEISVTSARECRSLSLAAGDARWRADGQPRPDLDGCADIDINCTPLTNTLPIRRLDWSMANAYDIDVAYVSVPELEVRKARQRYTRQDDGGARSASFRYESGSFQRDLAVDKDGFVLDYPGLWQRLPSG
jgi:uncharacterized protein